MTGFSYYPDKITVGITVFPGDQAAKLAQNTSNISPQQDCKDTHSQGTHGNSWTFRATLVHTWNGLTYINKCYRHCPSILRYKLVLTNFDLLHFSVLDSIQQEIMSFALCWTSLSWVGLRVQSGSVNLHKWQEIHRERHQWVKLTLRTWLFLYWGTELFQSLRNMSMFSEVFYERVKGTVSCLDNSMSLGFNPLLHPVRLLCYHDMMCAPSL